MNIPTPQELLQSLTDPDDCDYDHNRSCQAHMYFYLKADEICPQEELKKLLDSYR